MINQRKARATVGPYAPNFPGYTRPTMHETMGCNSEKRSQPPKLMPSSNRGLQLTLVKLESLVDERHYRSSNTSPLLAHTARQAIRVDFERGFFFLGKSSLFSARGAKSQQGSRTGRCGWITSFYIFIGKHQGLGL